MRYLNGKATISAVKFDYKFVQKDTLWQKLKANCLSVGRISPHGYNIHYSDSVLPLQHWNWRLLDIQHLITTPSLIANFLLRMYTFSTPIKTSKQSITTCFLKGKIYKLSPHNQYVKKPTASLLYSMSQKIQLERVWRTPPETDTASVHVGRRGNQLFLKHSWWRFH